MYPKIGIGSGMRSIGESRYNVAKAQAIRTGQGFSLSAAALTNPTDLLNPPRRAGLRLGSTQAFSRRYDFDRRLSCRLHSRRFKR